jgi:hypothetical protein
MLAPDWLMFKSSLKVEYLGHIFKKCCRVVPSKHSQVGPICLKIVYCRPFDEGIFWHIIYIFNNNIRSTGYYFLLQRLPWRMKGITTQK